MLLTVEELQEHPIRFDEVFAPGSIDYALQGLRQVGRLSIKGSASLLEREIHIRGHLETELESTCARCLDPAPRKVSREFDLFYRPLADVPREDEQAVPSGEEDLGFYRAPGLVLEDLCREQVLLSLPMRIVCREDCRGLCPQCGANWNREVCPHIKN